MIRCGAAAAAHDVDPTVLGELAKYRSGPVRRLVVPAKLVRQPGIGMAANKGAANVRQLFDIGTHHLAAQRAIDADTQRIRVRHRGPEGVERLTGQRPAAGIGDGHRDHDGQTDAVVLEIAVHGEQAGLQVQRVESRFGQEEVHPPVDQPGNLVRVRGHQVVERDRSVRRVVDVRGHRCGPVRRPHAAGDESRLLGRGRRERVRLFSSDLGGRPVDGEHFRSELVIGQRDRRRVKRVGFEDVGASVQELTVDLSNDGRLSYAEQVVAALQVHGVVGKLPAPEVPFAQLPRLDHRPHGAVEHQKTR